jgi:hypothetical protein
MTERQRERETERRQKDRELMSSPRQLWVTTMES